MRPSVDDIFLEVAETISKRSTCLRRRFGAVIVRDKIILSTGYNGSPRGEEHCSEIGNCLRRELEIPKGERYEVCRAVHAECNAVINAARQGIAIDKGTMYLYGYDIEDDAEIAVPSPCQLCAPIIRNAGLKRVVGRNPQTVELLEWDFSTTY